MTKAEIIKKINQKTRIGTHNIQRVTEELLTLIQDVVASGEGVYFRGFGTFKQKKRARKIARNITKNTAVVIDEHYIPSFKPSPFFYKKMGKNSNFFQ